MNVPFIVGPTGRQIALQDPDFNIPQDDLLKEIATGLSQTFRFSGHTRPLYTVAQHSVLLTKLDPDGNPACFLLHDASEAYLGDIPKPLKELLPDYQKIEDLFQYRICHALGCACPPAAYKDADYRAMLCEMHLIGFGLPAYGIEEPAIPSDPKGFSSANKDLLTAAKFMSRIWSREEAKNQWLEAWYAERFGRNPSGRKTVTIDGSTTIKAVAYFNGHHNAPRVGITINGSDPRRSGQTRMQQERDGVVVRS